MAHPTKHACRTRKINTKQTQLSPQTGSVVP